MKKPGSDISVPSSGKASLARKIAAPALVSAALCSVALMYVNIIAALLGFPLLMYALLRAGTKKQAFYAGALFGGASSLVLNAWMITVITSYVKGSMLMGLLCYLASAAVLSLLSGLMFYLFGLFRLSEDRKFSLVNNALLISSLWVVFELIRGELFSAMPWLSFSAGITEARSLYLIQPASFGGVHLLSFLLILSSYSIAYAFYKRRWKLLTVPLLILAFQFAAGALMFNNTVKQTASPGEKKFTAALIIPALTPATVWDDNSADALVSRLLSLNAQATQNKPDLAVWTETVVPWTFTPADDFLKEVVSRTSAANTHTLIGMNTAIDSTSEMLSNSVYLLAPSGDGHKRYDKQDLLTLVEKPLFSDEGNMILPFLASQGMKMRAGSFGLPVETPWGKAGLLLCNESTSSSVAKRLVNEGASFLVNMGNDSWFSDHFITVQHFYNCRLRAVENRKDIIINNNMGAAGIVRASGEIAAEFDGRKSSVKVVEVYPNGMASFNKNIFTVLICALLIITIINSLTKSKINL